MDIKNIYNAVIFTSAALSIKDALIEAVSKRANLYEANLRGANLYGANLSRANLYGADLRGANLRGANLRGANLYGANLYGADLREANLYGADLRGANLRGANLLEANLRGADLSEANLREADLRGANLRGAKNADLAIARLQFIPTEGAFIGWKMCRDGAIVKLGISKEAKRSHGSERKCRCSMAKCLAIWRADGTETDEARSLHNENFVYRVGKVITPSGFDEDRWNTCGEGLHFYITRAEAEAHQ